MVIGAIQASVAATIAIVQMVFGSEYHIPLLIVIKMLPFNQFLLHIVSALLVNPVQSL